MARSPTVDLGLGPPRGTAQTIRSLLPYIWPKHDPVGRLRVIAAGGFLLLAKGATVLMPIVYSRAVDALAPQGRTGGHLLPTHVAGAALTVPAALIVAYGLLRLGSTGFSEL